MLQTIAENIPPNALPFLKTFETVDAIEAFSDDEVIVIRNSSNLEITEVEKGDFGKKSIVAEDDALSEEELSVRAFSDNIRLRYPLDKDDRVKISAYNSKDEMIYTSIDNKASGDIRHSIDISHWKEGEYWIELAIGKKRLTKKVTIKE